MRLESTIMFETYKCSNCGHNEVYARALQDWPADRCLCPKCKARCHVKTEMGVDVDLIVMPSSKNRLDFYMEGAKPPEIIPYPAKEEKNEEQDDHLRFGNLEDFLGELGPDWEPDL